MSLLNNTGTAENIATSMRGSRPSRRVAAMTPSTTSPSAAKAESVGVSPPLASDTASPTVRATAFTAVGLVEGQGANRGDESKCSDTSMTGSRSSAPVVPKVSEASPSGVASKAISKEDGKKEQREGRAVRKEKEKKIAKLAGAPAVDEDMAKQSDQRDKR